MAFAKKTLSDESANWLTRSSFSGMFSTVENKENTGSLDSLVLSHQGERTYKWLASSGGIFNLECSKPLFQG